MTCRIMPGLYGLQHPQYALSFTRGVCVLFKSKAAGGGGTSSNQITITNWVAWTPTFSGFGTPTAITLRSRRVGSNLEILGDFVTGTTDGTQANFTLGFAGANGGIAAATWLSASNVRVGEWGYGAVSTIGVTSVLATASDTTLGFGFSDGAHSSTTRVNGNVVFGASKQVAVIASVPIDGWTANN